VCTACGDTFETREERHLPQPPTNVRKRNGVLEDFDVRKIRVSITKALVNPAARVPQSVIEGVLARIQDALAGGKAEISSRDIAKTILQELTTNQQIHAVSRIRYALATLGDNREAGGFATLEDLEGWLKTEWPQRDGKRPPQNRPATKPVTVVKRGDRSPETWSDEKLIRSIEVSARGRGDAQYVEQLALRTAARARDSLRHHTTVTAEQVGVEVMRALRNEPLAYLWYASRAKRFKSATQVWNELQDLLQEDQKETTANADT